MSIRTSVQALAILVVTVPSAHAQVQPRRAPVYFVWVASGGYNEVALVRFGPTGATIEHRTPIAVASGDAGVRAIELAPDKRIYYVAATHGFPSGELLKVHIAMDSSPRMRQPPDTVTGTEPLGIRPSAIAITADGRTAWVTNAGDTADGARGSVSIVYLDRMAEVARLPTCGAADGSVLTRDGSRHYSVCGRADALIEFDARRMTPTRWFNVEAGHERGDTVSQLPPPAALVSCDPDWVAPSPDDARLYVVCRRSGDVVEIDRAAWTFVRRIAVGAAPQWCVATPDGRWLVTANAGEQSVSIVDLSTGKVAARVIIPRRMPTMAVVQAGTWDPLMALLFGRMILPQTPMAGAVSADSRYAFIAVAGIAGETGTVAVIDLATFRIVADLPVGSGASGVAFWKMEAAPAGASSSGGTPSHEVPPHSVDAH